MTDSKTRREFWITGFKFGDKESCSQHCTVELSERKDRNVMHVREVLPGDIILSASEVEKLRSLLKASLYTDDGSDIEDALDIIEKRSGK